MGCDNKKSCNKSNNNKKCCHCHCHCNCNNSMKEWRKFPNCPKKKHRKDVYMYLGEYVYDLLEEADLPCGHDSLDKIILMTLLDKKHCCC